MANAGSRYEEINHDELRGQVAIEQGLTGIKFIIAVGGRLE